MGRVCTRAKLFRQKGKAGALKNNMKVACVHLKNANRIEIEFVQYQEQYLSIGSTCTSCPASTISPSQTEGAC
jgi:hypothetical protein